MATPTTCCIAAQGAITPVLPAPSYTAPVNTLTLLMGTCLPPCQPLSTCIQYILPLSARVLQDCGHGSAKAGSSWQPFVKWQEGGRELGLDVSQFAVIAFLTNTSLNCYLIYTNMNGTWICVQLYILPSLIMCMLGWKAQCFVAYPNSKTGSNLHMTMSEKG